MNKKILVLFVVSLFVNHFASCDVETWFITDLSKNVDLESVPKVTENCFFDTSKFVEYETIRCLEAFAKNSKAHIDFMLVRQDGSENFICVKHGDGSQILIFIDDCDDQDICDELLESIKTFFTTSEFMQKARERAERRRSAGAHGTPVRVEKKYGLKMSPPKPTKEEQEQSNREFIRYISH
jgi:hypothetical protein